MIIKQTFIIGGAAGKPILADLTFRTGHQDVPLIIFVHGFKGFKDWGTHNLVADYFAGQKFRFLKFNFSHNGTTPEDPVNFVDLGAFSDNTFTKEFEDLDHVITFAKSGKEFSAPSSIYLLGHSRGGGTSIIQTAKDERIDKLVTWAAISDFSSLWKKEDEEEWRKKGVIFTFNTRTKQYTPLKIDLLQDLEKHPRAYNILLAAEQIKKPWLIIHGDEDESVSPDQAEKLKQKSGSAELFIVPHANHVFGASHPYTREELPMELQLVCEKSAEFLKKP